MNAIVILCDTLRRDHCGPYHLGRPVSQCGYPEQPDWVIPTPNLDRLARRGTVFDNAWMGSAPCMPARRDLHTGRYEFPWRGWGPLAEDDLDLPRQVSGAPNQSVSLMMQNHLPVSCLVTDHFHLWEQGSGNYHMGYTGFEFIRGHEADAWYTDPVAFACNERERLTKNERHFRNVHFTRKSEADWFAPQVFQAAADWLERNRGHESFFLNIDCFDPHEPWDPPEEMVKAFDPRGYKDDFRSTAPYSKWRGAMSEAEFTNLRARYTAHVALTDRALGLLLDRMDALDLWDDTLLIFTTDHGTFNGDFGRMGKLQTHTHSSIANIPFIVCHPDLAHGERREQLVQLVDIYPTVLSALGREIPPDRHGVDLTPVLADSRAQTRAHAVCGMFGQSVTITDGRWVLHQPPAAENSPLYWYDYCLAKFLPYDLGPYVNGRREVRNCHLFEGDVWLSDRAADPAERRNLAESNPRRLRAMQGALKDALIRLDAPSEQLDRLGLRQL